MTNHTQHNTVFADLASQAGLGSCLRQELVAAHASKRHIVRLILDNGRSVIAVSGDNLPENKAFIGFSQSFRSQDIPAPEIYAVSADGKAYIQQDLGTVSLYDRVKQTGVEHAVPDYYTALETLALMAQAGLDGLDTSLCFEGEEFDSNAIASDIAYFARYFLAARDIPYDDVTLRHEAHRLAALALGTNRFFMHRDFQSRNLMFYQNRYWVIDFQAGRAGPLAYDLASLLNQSSLQMSYGDREQLIDVYLGMLTTENRPEAGLFQNDYWVYSLARKLQNLGAYGRFGLGEGKPYFLRSIEPALDDIDYLMSLWPRALDCPHLNKCLSKALLDR